MPNLPNVGREWKDIWSYGSGTRLTDLLSSALALLLVVPPERPTYFASPYISDFELFNNEARNVASLFPALADQSKIRFKQFLIALSQVSDAWLITTESDSSLQFLDDEELRASEVQVRYAPDTAHEKGILADTFYLEGSMNLTFKGAHINGEKVTYYAGGTPNGEEKLSTAYIEFNRRWQNLQANK